MSAVSYEWDEAKRVENLEKHSVDFVAVGHFDWETAVVFRDLRRDYAEPRFIAYGLLSERLHVLVYTPRRDRRRVISLRKANLREQAAYALGAPHRGG